jgi:hypothetical protein
MEIGNIPGATHQLGAPEKWDAEKNGPCAVLPARLEHLGDSPCFASMWIPTREEIVLIARGHPIILRVVGGGHPPVMLSVDD